LMPMPATIATTTIPASTTQRLLFIEQNCKP
jgi:hypothetical protein